ncbi:hypothetical protein ACFX13_036101 [Malus domestica]
MAFLIHTLFSHVQHLGIFVGVVFWLLLSCSFCFAVESDINCLKSIKDSLNDTLGYLNSSWDFSNKTEGFLCNFLGIECWHPHESKVLKIKLSGLGLKSQFPRGVANCTSLTGLDLSRNMLNGPLPTDIGRLLSFLTYLDLSSNSFSGSIPANLSNCTYMNVLMLDNNKFTGKIPPQLSQLSRLTRFTVANNLLSGQVPDFGNATVFITTNNNGLCGGTLTPCRSSEVKTSIDLVKVLKSHSVVIAAAAGFGFAFPLSFCFFLPRAPSVRSLWVFYRGFKLR